MKSLMPKSGKSSHGFHRWLISRYVTVDDLADRIIEGLGKAGLADIE